MPGTYIDVYRTLSLRAVSMKLYYLLKMTSIRFGRNLEVAKSIRNDRTYLGCRRSLHLMIDLTREHLSILTKGEILFNIEPYTPDKKTFSIDELKEFALTLPKDVHQRLLHTVHNKEFLKVIGQRKRKRQLDEYNAKRNPTRKKSCNISKTDNTVEEEWTREKSDKSFPDIVDAATKDRCMKDFIKATGDDAVKRSVCVVCARELWYNEGRERSLDPSHAKALAPKETHEPYAKDSIDGMLLLKSRVKMAHEGCKDSKAAKKASCTGWTCDLCWSYISKGSKPPLSLSNGMWIGDIPEELQDLTFTEELLIARAHPRCYVFKLFPRMSRYGISPEGLQRGMKGNITSYHANVDSIAEMVQGNMMPRPLSILPHLIAVCFIGVGKLPKDWIRKTFAVRRDKLRRALHWLKDNNVFYKDIEIPEQRIQDLPEDDVPEEIKGTLREVSNAEEAERERAGYIPEEENEDAHCSSNGEISLAIVVSVLI